MNSSTELLSTTEIDFRYGRIAYFVNDSGAIRVSLEKYGEWAENEISFMVAFLPNGATVLDVGAYIGTHTIAFAHAVGQTGHVVSIEAQSKSFQLLQNNVAANNLTNVEILNVIAGDKFEVREVACINPDVIQSFGSTSLATTSFETRETIKIRTITLDSINLSRCDLIKIDVEGMEANVLAGASETIHRLKPVVYAECNTLEDGLRTLSFLRGAGYTTYAHVVRAYNPGNFKQTGENVFNGAREVAIVGAIGQSAETCRSYTPREVELFLEVETADDLALALINKPQYASEVMRQSAACRTGGNLVLDLQQQYQLDIESHRADIERLRQVVIDDSEEKLRLESIAGTLKNEVDELSRDVSILRGRVSNEEAAKNRLSDENLQLKASVDALTQQVALELAANNTMQQRSAMLLTELSETKKRAQSEEAALRNQIQEIYLSTSWRLTAPLRFVVRLMKGVTAR